MDTGSHTEGFHAFITTLAGQLIFKGADFADWRGKAQGPVSDSFAQMGRGFLLNSASIIFCSADYVPVCCVHIEKETFTENYGLPVLSVRGEFQNSCSRRAFDFAARSASGV